jgi:hypothetical protein
VITGICPRISTYVKKDRRLLQFVPDEQVNPDCKGYFELKKLGIFVSLSTNSRTWYCPTNNLNRKLKWA